MNNYIEILRGCSTVIMTYLSQQAADKLLMSLFLGDRVYLDPKNSVYEEHRNQGLVFRNINDLVTDQPLLSSLLDTESVKTNRNILQSSKGRASHQQITEELISALIKIKKQKALNSEGVY
ncbi:hypothetical protein LL273_03700 [Marinobacter salarius]|uniref:hypothetical protein n=1 Tax=Marinobacter salarius TaxID=1420917 RepID=UPI001D18FCAC|nr:hypothetical protein [Marinobacter salarius]MCC4282811.1 hypothetical protein [Marinobacter salarius]